MDQTAASPEPEPARHPANDVEPPPGNHPLEVAARRGIGPLSPLGRDLWHGHTWPCVSCGQLVLRNAKACDHCGQDLSKEMLEKMLAHAGPWYVLEHVRPFPGVSLERIIRQVRRGVITETSIVRGPPTNYQWRFAVETPGLCRYFGRCWSCHEEVSPSDTHCKYCLSSLSFEQPRSAPAVPPSPTAVVSAASTGSDAPDFGPSPDRETVGRAVPTETLTEGSRQHAAAPLPPIDELTRLSAVVDQAAVPVHDTIWDEPPRVAGIRATWIAAAMLIVVIIALMFLTQSRSPEPPPPPPPTAGANLPR
ncbi:MAG: zinc ribbon domain-containing protein [Phycisphaerales bacterium]|nr:MAG: zinc ribbon domain-containing protein [Phycisphaerales bacterium]